MLNAKYPGVLMPIPCTHRQSGFSLVEISIVVVIIGLLMAGATTGYKLVKVQELKSIISQTQAYQEAAITFYSKYGGWPGDIPNATSYWAGTANGNGNNIIVTWTGGPNSNEGYRAWQQLALAKMIRGSYTGIGGAGGNQMDAGINVPSGPRAGLGYYMTKWNTLPLNGVGLAKEHSSAVYMNEGPGLSPKDAYYIDEKIDDSFARSGDVWGAITVAGNQCYTGSAYNFTLSTLECEVIFMFDIPSP